MRKYCLLLVIMIGACGCKKTGVKPGIFGKWELRHRMGSIVGFDSTFNAGNGRVLQFNTDSTYRQFNKGKLAAQGKFHVKPTDYPEANSSALLFEGSDFQNVLIIKGDKLQIGMDIDDGVENDYQKISD